MATIHIKPIQDSKEILRLIQSAIESEIVKLELALKIAKGRLALFEEKYGVSTDYFIAQMTAEDLEGKDEEYVHWAGEYKLMQRLQDKLQKLQAVDYDDPNLLHSDQNDS